MKDTPAFSLMTAKPHDHYFKSVGSIPEVAIELLKVGLPKKVLKKLRLETLSTEPTSFIDEGLQEHLSDLIYTCELKKGGEKIRVCLLFEHKRKISQRELILQIIRYILNILEDDLRNDREGFTLPIPIIIYNGEEKWDELQMRDLFEKLPNELKKYLLDFEYEAINLNKMSDENILAMRDTMLVRNIFLAMKHAWDDEFYKNNIPNLLIFEAENMNLSVLQILANLTISYIINVSSIKKEEVMQATQVLPADLRAGVKTTAMMLFEEGLEKGVKKGEKKGMEKGRDEGMNTAVIQFLAKFPKSTDNEVAEIFNLPVLRVKNLREELQNAAQAKTTSIQNSKKTSKKGKTL